MYGCVIWRDDVCMGVLYGGMMCVWVCICTHVTSPYNTHHPSISVLRSLLHTHITPLYTSAHITPP